MLSRDIVHISIENKESFENLRLWCILRKDHAHRSGHFTLDELVSVMLNRGQKSLLDSSNAKKYKSAKTADLQNSILFTHLKDDLYQFNSEKKILIAFKGSTGTHKFKIPDEALNSKRLFLDYCIGAFQVKKKFCNQKYGDLFGVDPRRIQQATSRNHVKGWFIKTHRKVLEPFSSLSKASETALKLKQSGIYSSKPLIFGKDYAITVNTTNQYESGVLRRYYGKMQFKAYTRQTKVWNWFKPLFKGKSLCDIRQNWEYRLKAKLLQFTNVYSLNDFVRDHGIYA